MSNLHGLLSMAFDQQRLVDRIWFWLRIILFSNWLDICCICKRKNIGGRVSASAPDVAVVPGLMEAKVLVGVAAANGRAATTAFLSTVSSIIEAM